MIPTEIIYHRRLCVLEHAERTRSFAATCRVFGISRKTFYEWKARSSATPSRPSCPSPDAVPSCPRHPHPRGQRAVEPNCGRDHHRLPSEPTAWRVERLAR